MRLAQRDGSSWKTSRWWPPCEVTGTAMQRKRAGKQRVCLETSQPQVARAWCSGVGWGGGKRRAERET